MGGLVMKRIYYMENGKKVYYFGEFTEKHAHELVAIKAKRGRYCFIEDAEEEEK